MIIQCFSTIAITCIHQFVSIPVLIYPSQTLYSNMSLNVPRPFPKMGTLLHLQNGYIHLKDTKRVHCCTSGKQAELGTLLDFWEKNVNNVIF